MSYEQGLTIAEKYGLAPEFRRAYRFFKPWWKFWMSESDAVMHALEDWDMGIYL